MKSAKDKKNFLEHLRKLPNISSACEATNTSRQTIYRWKADDKKFASNLEEALSEGNDYMCDFVESQLISKIRDKHFPAIKYHLNKRHPKYMEKKTSVIEIDSINQNANDQELMDKARQEVINRSIRYSRGNDGEIRTDENSIKNMLKWNIIDQSNYEFLMMASGYEPEDVTSDKLIHEDLEIMNPDPEEIQKEYLKLKKEKT